MLRPRFRGEGNQSVAVELRSSDLMDRQSSRQQRPRRFPPPHAEESRLLSPQQQQQLLLRQSVAAAARTQTCLTPVYGLRLPPVHLQEVSRCRGEVWRRGDQSRLRERTRQLQKFKMAAPVRR